MKRLLSILAMCPAIFYAGKIDPGGWDKIKWGMTLDDVKRFYENSAGSSTDQLMISGIKVSDPSFDMQATVKAKEGSHVVSSVTLSLSDENLKKIRLGRGVAFDILKRLLIEKYWP